MTNQFETPDTTCTFDEFMKIDIRAGVITKSEPVPKSSKLLKLEVYFGPEIGHRTILSGIAKSYRGDVTGLGVIAVVNLAPRQMMGYESHGMLLAGGWPNGEVTLIDCAGCEPGTRIG